MSADKGPRQNVMLVDGENLHNSVPDASLSFESPRPILDQHNKSQHFKKGTLERKNSDMSFGSKKKGSQILSIVSSGRQTPTKEGGTGEVVGNGIVDKTGDPKFETQRNEEPAIQGPEEQQEKARLELPETKTQAQEDDDKDSVTSEYEMISDIFDYQALRYEENFVIKRYKTAVYRGQLNIAKGQREGFGVLTAQNGRIYEGEWLADKRNGQGYETYKTGNIYKGAFMNNKPHGKGHYTWFHGETYEGEWIQGCKNGFGIWKGIFNDSYMGEWRDNKVWGYGVHQWTNGDKYEGEWARSLKNGQGTDYFANQDQYSGQYLDGKPDGYGVYKWKSGAQYVGEFKQGMKHGKGKWKKDEKNPKCNQYTGDYFNDKKHGHGQFNWESGNYYIGSYVEDQRHGYGEMYWVDGSKYKGDWEQGVQHGFGEITLPDGKIKKGKFENNVYVGKVEEDTVKPLPLQGMSKDPPVMPKEDVAEKMVQQASPPMAKQPIIQPPARYEIQIQTDPVPKKMKEKQIQTKEQKPSPAPVEKPKKLKTKSNQTREVPNIPTPRPKLKEKQNQTKKEEQKIVTPQRNVITQTPQQKQLVSHEIQTQKEITNTEVQTKKQVNEIKIQTDENYEDPQDQKLAQQLDSEAKEVQQLQKQLAKNEENSDDEVVVFQEPTIPPLSPLKPPQPKIIQRKKPKAPKDVPMNDARINTHVVMPQGNSKMSQYSRNNESDDNNAQQRAGGQNQGNRSQRYGTINHSNDPTGNGRILNKNSNSYNQLLSNNAAQNGANDRLNRTRNNNPNLNTINDNSYGVGPNPAYNEDPNIVNNTLTHQNSARSGGINPMITSPEQQYNTLSPQIDSNYGSPLKTLNGLPPLASNQHSKNVHLNPLANKQRAAANNSQQFYTGQGKNVTPEMMAYNSQNRAGNQSVDPNHYLEGSPSEMVMQPVIAMEIKSNFPKQSRLSHVSKSMVGQPKPSFLPEIATTRQSQSIHPQQLDSETESQTSTTNVDQMRRASKRAINMLMKNMKKQKNAVWVPSGRQVKQGRIFHKNYKTGVRNSTVNIGNLSQRS